MSNVDYNDGLWHGWNNDRPMPTHPRSRVQCVTDEGRMDETDAALVNWNDSETPIRSFRVTRVAREPREIWMNEYPDGFIGRTYPSEVELRLREVGTAKIMPVRFREVLE